MWVVYDLLKFSLLKGEFPIACTSLAAESRVHVQDRAQPVRPARVRRVDVAARSAEAVVSSTSPPQDFSAGVPGVTAHAWYFSPAARRGTPS